MDDFPLCLCQIYSGGPLSRPHILVFTICIGSPIFRRISKQTENCVFGWESFSCEIHFARHRGKKRSSAVALSPRSRCVFEATVVIVIYYREVCKRSFRAEGEKKTKTGSMGARIQTHTWETAHISVCALPSFSGFCIHFLHHNLLSNVYRVPSLNNRCIRKWSISTTVKVYE